jgi:hypothetical protein
MEFNWAFKALIQVTLQNESYYFLFSERFVAELHLLQELNKIFTASEHSLDRLNIITTLDVVLAN